MAVDTYPGGDLQGLEAFVRGHMAAYDCSHDWLHVQRVRAMARRLAEQEMALGKTVNLQVVDIAALVHDIGDAKYTAEGLPSARDQILGVLSRFGYAGGMAERVCGIVEQVSFRKELELLEQGQTIDLSNHELACVQDADRLDAIGAIGVARCLSFSAAKSRPIYLPDAPPVKVLTAAEYMRLSASPTANLSALNHFHEKLLHLAGMMKTEGAKGEAGRRTAFMQEFISHIKDECEIPW